LNPITAIRDIPQTTGAAFKKFRMGMGGIRNNWRAAGTIRKRVKQGGALTTLQEVTLLRKQGEDSMKLLQAGFVYLTVPEMATLMLCINPKMLPSTFEGDEGRLNRWRQLQRMRTSAVMQLLWDLEEETVKKGKRGMRGAERVQIAEGMLRSRQPLQGVRVVEEFTRPTKGSSVQVAKKPVEGIPKPVLKAACRLIGIQFAIPGTRPAALRKHLQMLVEEDAALARTDWSTLSHTDLADACFDRALGCIGDSDKEMRQMLRCWCELTDESRFATPDGVTPDPARLRLAAMSVSAVASCRKEKGKLSHMLYAP